MTPGTLSAPGPRVALAARGVTREVDWGQRWQCGTAAHWVALTQETAPRDSGSHHHRLGQTLREEVAACLLGGFGLPFELGLAAYGAVRDAGCLEPGASPSSADLEAVLRAPLLVGNAWRRYRFPAQRASRLAGALDYIAHHDLPPSPLAVRDWLLRAPGIGPKTASWVVRNHYGSDDVAVLDVHVMRAGKVAGVFDRTWTPIRHYALIEGFFLSWAQHGSVPAGDLDAVIWSEQVELSRSGRRRRHA